MKNILHIIFLFAFLLFFSECKKAVKDPVEIPESTAPLKISFENVVGTSSLILNSTNYLNANGDTFNVTMYKYYITNIKLKKEDGTYYSEDKSYHLVNQSVSSSLLLTLPYVPVGNYTTIDFLIGVDSTKNVSGVQSGDLDPAKGMFWSWNSGYIMAKFEGTSPQSGSPYKDLAFHIGGFSGADNSLRSVTLSFNGSLAKISKQTNPQLNITCDVLQWFKSPANINFANTYDVTMPGADAKKFADNYADMFAFKSITN